MRRTWPLLLVPVKCIAADIRGVRVSGNERGGGVVRWWGGKWLGRGADKRTGVIVSRCFGRDAWARARRSAEDEGVPTGR